MQTRDEIEDNIKNGLVKDIFLFDRSFGILQTIKEHSSTIDKNRENFVELFIAIHGALTIEAVLAVARIYDNPNKNYPTRCLKGMLEHLITYSRELPEIREPYQLKLSLETKVVPDDLIKAIKDSPTTFPNLLSDFIKKELEKPENVDAIKKLKDLRDKAMAHNERVAQIDGPSWAALNDLCDLSKYVVGALSWAYFSTAYTINGKYILTDDAQTTSYSLSRLLKKVYGDSA
jgi:AbiU2